MRRLRQLLPRLFAATPETLTGIFARNARRQADGIFCRGGARQPFAPPQKVPAVGTAPASSSSYRVRREAGVAVLKRVAGLAVVIALSTGCGQSGESRADSASQPPSEQQPAPEGDAHLVDSQATLPREPADEFADIATTSADARTVWQRFNLAGHPPQVDFDTVALLFVGFGESGSCPARFDGVSVDGDRVHLAIGTEGGPVCTSDYNPRTMVLEVARDALPDGGFELTISGRTFVLSSVPLSEPLPSDDAIVGRLTSESPLLGFDAQPGSVPGGGRIGLVLANEGDVSASTGSWSMALYRWDDQRWLPADGDEGSGETQWQHRGGGCHR